MNISKTNIDRIAVLRYDVEKAWEAVKVVKRSLKEANSSNTSSNVKEAMLQYAKAVEVFEKETNKLKRQITF